MFERKTRSGEVQIATPYLYSKGSNCATLSQLRRSETLLSRQRPNSFFPIFCEPRPSTVAFSVRRNLPLHGQRASGRAKKTKGRKTNRRKAGKVKPRKNALSAITSNNYGLEHIHSRLHPKSPCLFSCCVSHLFSQNLGRPSPVEAKDWWATMVRTMPDLRSNIPTGTSQHYFTLRHVK